MCFLLCWLTDVEKKPSGNLTLSAELLCVFPVFVVNIKLCLEERTLKVLGIECIFPLRTVVCIYQLTLDFLLKDRDRV